MIIHYVSPPECITTKKICKIILCLYFRNVEMLTQIPCFCSKTIPESNA